MGKRRYDPDCKREAVRLVLVVLEEGMGVREVERNLDITFGVVKGWVQQHDLWGKTSKTLQGYNEFRA